MASQRLIAGRGINDADYTVQIRRAVGSWRCPYYSAWSRMIRSKAPVSDDFLRFSNFRKWMSRQDWEGMVMDRLLFGDGLLYSPQNCCFLERKIAVIVREARWGREGGIDKPQGDHPAKPWRVVVNGQHLGYFATLKEAEEVWRRAKRAIIREHIYNYRPKIQRELRRLFK